jgi:K+-transporting ATPase ATPase C chain
MNNSQSNSASSTPHTPHVAVLRPAIVCFVLLSLITGAIYPAIVTGIAQVAFRSGANGSLIERDGKAIGSELIGQNFTGPGYFWTRPSAAGATGYDGASASGSNLGPNNPAWHEAVGERVKALRAAHPERADGPVPTDLVTASGSGLDPHLSPEAVEYQLARVAKARNMSEADLRQLIAALTEPRLFGVLGEPRVNVLKLNLALDQPSAGRVSHHSSPMGYRWRGFAGGAE